MRDGYAGYAGRYWKDEGDGYAGRYWKDMRDGPPWEGDMRDMRDGPPWEGDMRDMRDMRDVIGRMRGTDMRDGPPPRNRPGRAAVFWTSPPQSTKDGKQERQTICEPKKECLFCI